MNYFNEFDAGAAEWLRELMADGIIARGEVDETDIRKVRADDIRGCVSVHLFAGIGGWAHALDLAGWPRDRPVWTGSCPCQPYSAAGKGKGDADERNLWPEMFRLIRECRPVTVFGEQVEGAVKHGWLDRVCADLEGEGYAVGSCVLGAHSVGAPHIRQRLYWVADSPVRGRQQFTGARPAGLLDQTASAKEQMQQPCADGASVCGLADTNGSGRAQPGCAVADGAEHAAAQRTGDIGFWSDYYLLPCRDGKARRAEPGIFPLAARLPGRVALLRGAGNAICPQTAAAFIAAFLEVK